MEEFTRTYSLIHLDSIYHNIDMVKKQVGTDTKILAIVKANAYGHGAVRVAKAVRDRVYGFAVATVKEALELRHNGIDNFILILGYACKAEYETMIRNNITFALLSEEMARDISECAERLNMTAECHIKINTGMNRIGFPVNDDTVSSIEKICKMPNLNCEGIFMHFATADENDKTFSRQQFDLFMQLINRLEDRGITFAIKHCANSAAIIDMPEYRLDMVREGIVLYGLMPSEEVSRTLEFKPAMEIKSHVIFVKELPAGEGISYGRTYVTPRTMRVATVAIGYADGYPRALSSKGYVLIHGKKAPILGRVCMDQMMVDVSDIPETKVEDVVTIVGTDGEASITVDELAAISGRFNYEFVCDVSERVERKYVL
ncbi:MAG: alanine racemase [Butyrivibrio sp.]